MDAPIDAKSAVVFFSRAGTSRSGEDVSMRRPELNEVPVPDLLNLPPIVIVTMAPGQWDTLLQSSYDSGFLLLEIEDFGDSERIARAFRKSIQ